MLEGLRQRDFIRDTFGRYLSKEVVEELLGSPDGLKIGGEVREVTLLVSDLRGFTSMAANALPQEVLPILNRYLECMVDIIMRYRSTVDEFQGDGILAFFGAPIARPDDPERAIACAIEMQRALVAFNAEQQRRHLPELAMGIGINTGKVIVGNIGSEKRTKYGAVGSAINTAYRIESYTVGGQILVSPHTYQRVEALIGVRDTLEVQFKGLDTPLMLYNVARLSGRYACALPDVAPMVFTRLSRPCPVTCCVIEGKTVSEVVMNGQITSLAVAAAEVALHEPLAPHVNIKLILSAAAGTALPEIYAKVLAVDTTAAGPYGTLVRVGLTSVPPAAKAFLEQLRTTALSQDHMRVG
jgi:class 3 adenylate cyclase